jgi:hypothetical protein
MHDSHDTLTVEGQARWSFSVGAVALTDRASRNIQIFRWLEAIRAEAVSGAGEVDAEIAAEIRRLDAKLSMVLDLLLERSGLESGLGSAVTFSLAATGVSWTCDTAMTSTALNEGDIGLLAWHPEPRWPTALQFVARATSVSPQHLRFEFLNMGEPERDCLERWIFREHRRLRERYR